MSIEMRSRRRNRRAILAAACGLASLCPVPGRAALVSSTWDGTTGNWGNPARWTPNTFFPHNGNGGNTFDATIGGGIVTLDVDPNIQKFNFNGGQLITTGRGLFTSDIFTWTGGIISGTGSINILGGMVISGTNQKRLESGQNVNFNSTGTIAATLQNLASAQFYNLPNGSIDLQLGTFNGGTFHNRGVLTKTTASTYNFIPTALESTGTIHVNAGLIEMQVGATHTGNFDGDGQITFRSVDTFAPSSKLLTRTILFIGTATVNGLFGPQNMTGHGPLTISGPQQYPVGALMSYQGPLLTLNTDAGGTGTGTGNLTLSLVNGGNGVFNTTQHFKELSIQTDASAVLSASGATGSKAIVTRKLQFSFNERLDLTRHGLVLDHDGGINFQVPRELLVSGYNAGAWNGTGIVSSLAAGGNGQTAVGYGESADLLGLSGTQTATFCGTTVDATSTLVRYTLYGDANLDGQVNFADLVRLAQSYNTTNGSGVWARGDFTYDGNIDFTDLVKLAQNYNTAVAAGPAPPGDPLAFEADWARAIASVPEPGLGFACAPLALALANGRRRASLPASPPPAPS